ncbi:MAG: MFS transporter [Pseudomonadota bacterium]
MTMAWIVWGLGALFYLVGFFQRVAPGVMTYELMQAFDISASGLGQLSGLYFYSYVAMQIPTGILADTLGPRKLLTAGCGLAGLGTLLFALSPGFIGAGCGRFLIGGSVAVAFVGLLKLSSTWFPKHFYSFVAGNALSIGLIGAVTAGPPLRYLMDIFEWRWVFCVTGVMTLVLGGLIWFFVRDWPQDKGYPGFTEKIALSPFSMGIIRQGLFQVLKYRNTWLLFFIPGGVVGCILTFSGLWGVPYLISHHHFSPGNAATLASSLLISWAVGGPFFGWLSSRMGKRKPLYILGTIIVAVGWSLILFRENFTFYPLMIVLLTTGFFSGSMIVSFSFACESVPGHLSGTVCGLTNMGIMMGPTLLQPIVGRLLDYHWAGGLENGVRLYSMEAYHYGFIPMMAWISLSVLFLFFTRETFCRQAVE